MDILTFSQSVPDCRNEKNRLYDASELVFSEKLNRMVSIGYYWKIPPNLRKPMVIKTR